MRLSQLPPDILRLFLPYLSANDLFCLFHTTKELQYRYEDQNFHTHLRYDLSVFSGLRLHLMPQICPNLLELRIDGFKIPSFSKIVLHLTPILRVLHMNFWNGLFDLCEAASTSSLASLFPHLEFLSIGSRCNQVENWAAQEWPRNLKALITPSMVLRDFHIALLPDSLEHLDVQLQTYHRQLQIRFPSSLSILNTGSQLLDLLELPPALTSLKIFSRNLTVAHALPGLRSLTCHSRIHPKLSFPALTCLSLPQMCIQEICPLSSHLTSLEAHNTLLSKSFSFRDLLSCLPASLTFISMAVSLHGKTFTYPPTDDIEPSSLPTLFPPSLTRWSGLTFVSSPYLFPKTLALQHISIYYTGGNLDHLPCSVTDLSILDPDPSYSTVKATISSLRSLKLLMIHSKVGLPIGETPQTPLWTLPQTLTYLYLRLNYDATAFSQDIIWPPMLENLEFSSEIHVEYPEKLLKGLPTSLRVLSFSVPQMSASALQYLPNRLLDLSIRTISEKTLPLGLQLSQRLVNLELVSASIIDLNLLSALPKSITTLHLHDYTPSNPQHLVPKVSTALPHLQELSWTTPSHCININIPEYI